MEINAIEIQRNVKSVNYFLHDQKKGHTLPKNCVLKNFRWETHLTYSLLTCSLTKLSLIGCQKGCYAAYIRY